MNEPSPTASSGRGASGKFGPGNKIARGNPYARRVARLRSALLRAVTPADLHDVTIRLVAQAKAGDVASIKELFQRLLGPPIELDFAERLDTLEKQIESLRQRRELP